jgi:uncharacterized protein (DUF1800 family)
MWQTKHFWNRAGFGASPTELIQYKNTKPKKLFKHLLGQSKDFSEIKLVQWESYQATIFKLENTGNNLNPDEKKQLADLLKKRRSEALALGVEWVRRMRNEGALREKTALFWHGILASRSANPDYTQKYLNTLRKHALDKFQVLLTAVSKEGSMLTFLNNNQNRKQNPNENFARELLELFTLGRGNYSEKDIKEAARAFTGWTTQRNSYTFEFRPDLHDHGPKTFLGQTGPWTGEDIIRIILEQKACANYLAGRMYTFFVNSVPNQQNINDLAHVLYQSNYNITKTLQYLFTQKWFYNKENIGVLIKSPTELILGYQKQLDLFFEEDEAIPFIGKILGQTLLFPPNVAGWPGHTHWIDSSSLLFRMQLPSFLLENTEIQYKNKDDGDEGTKYLNTSMNRFKCTFDLGPIQKWTKTNNNIPPAKWLASYICNVPLSQQSLDSIEKDLPNYQGTDALKYQIIHLCSAPEYQMI